MGGRQVCCGCIADGCRWVEALALPCEAAVDHPLEDAGSFGLELIRQVRIAFDLRDGDGQRYQVEAASDGFVHAAQ